MSSFSKKLQTLTQSSNSTPRLCRKLESSLLIITHTVFIIKFKKHIKINKAKRRRKESSP